MPLPLSSSGVGGGRATLDKDDEKDMPLVAVSGRGMAGLHEAYQQIGRALVARSRCSEVERGHRRHMVEMERSCSPLPDGADTTGRQHSDWRDAWWRRDRQTPLGRRHTADGPQCGRCPRQVRKRLETEFICRVTKTQRATVRPMPGGRSMFDEAHECVYSVSSELIHFQSQKSQARTAG